MDLFHKANIFYIDEDYESAVQAYTSAIDSIKNDAKLYSSRAAANLKLKKYTSALEDCNKALALDVINLIIFSIPINQTYCYLYCH